MNKQQGLFDRLQRTAGCAMILLLSACTLPFQEGGQARTAEIIHPADGTHVALGTALEIRARVSSPGSVSGVTLQANGQAVREDRFTNPSFTSGTVYQPWTPPAAGTYGLQVILIDTGGQVTSDVVTIFVEGAITPTVFTGTPSTGTPADLTKTPTSTPGTGATEATANQNANCRKGPSTAYGYAADFIAGQTAPIVGRNESSTWVLIEPRAGGGQCWVWVDLVTIAGNLSDAPVAAAPPLPITITPSLTKSPEPPEPSYTACHDYPDMPTCSSDPSGFGGCYWDTGMNKCQP